MIDPVAEMVWENCPFGGAMIVGGVLAWQQHFACHALALLDLLLVSSLTVMFRALALYLVRPFLSLEDLQA